jgi:hypothetical protein
MSNTSDEVLTAEAGAKMEAAGNEIAEILYPYFQSRKSVGDQVAAATGTLFVAVGAMKASHCKKALFLRMAASLWDRMVVITPEQALSVLTEKGGKQC